MSSLLQLIALSACRSADPAAMRVPPPVTVAIGDGGGEITVPAAGGSTLVLTFPPGAVDEPLEVTVTPRALAKGELFAASVTPGDLLVAEPVGVRIELPKDLATREDSALTIGRGIVPASIEPRVVTTELLMWSAAPAASPQAREGADASEESLSMLIEERVSLEYRLEAARAQLAAAETSNALGDTQAAADAIQDLRRYDGAGAALVDTFLEEAGERACRSFQLAEDTASRAAVDDYGEVRELSEPVIGWENVVREVGEDACPAAPSASEVLIPIADSANGFHDVGAATVSPETEGWDELVGELDEISTLGLEAAALGVEGVSELMDDVVGEPLVEALRPPAWDHCAAMGDQRAVGDLLAHRPGDEALTLDLHSCGTRMGYDSRAADGTTVQSGTVSGARPPTTPTLEAPVAVRSDGSITVTGSVRALTCPSGALDQEQLVVALDGTEVRRLDPNNGEYMLGAPSFEIRDLLTAAGVLTTDTAEHRLSFTREGTGCGAYGAGSAHVATLVLNPGEEVDLFGRYDGTMTYRSGYDATEDNSWVSDTAWIEILEDHFVSDDGRGGGSVDSLPYTELTDTSFLIYVAVYGYTSTATGTVTFEADGSATLTFSEDMYIPGQTDPFVTPSLWSAVDFVGTKPAPE